MTFRCLKLIPAFLSALTLIGPSVVAADAVSTPTYDWVPTESLTEAQKAKLGPACRGAYIDPLADHPITDPATTDIHVEAHTSHMAGSKISLGGDVVISQGARALRAEHMSYDRSSGEAALEGDVEIREPGIWVGGQKAEVKMDGNHAEFAGGEFVLHQTHMRGRAGNIEHKRSGEVVLTDGAVTSCEPGNESWIIKGQQLTVNPNTHQGTGRNVSIHMAGIPVFYAPYLTFPVGSDRQSGLLVPAMGTSNGGLDIALPWYWNIAPNRDATIAPRYIQGHGTMLEMEYRHLNSFSENEWTVAYLAEDQGGGDPDVDKILEQGTVEEALLRPYKGHDRWLFSYQHKGGDQGTWYSDINLTKASDIDYFRDLSVASFDVANNTYLSQGALFGYRFPNWHLQVRLQDYQSLLADVAESYRQVPRLTATAKYPIGSWEMSLKQEVVRFDHSDPNRITGDRVNLDYQMNWSKYWSFGFINPSFGVQALAYRLESDDLLPSAEDHPHFFTPYTSIDAGLIFEREQGLQTLEPRLFYLYRAYEDQSELYDVTSGAGGNPTDVNFDTTPLTFGYHQLFRDRRLSGGDRLDDAHQLTIGISSHWGVTHEQPLALDVSFGQIFYFDDRQVQLRRSDDDAIEESDLAAQVVATLSDRIRLHSDFLYNPKTKQVMRSTNGVEYRGKLDQLFNVGYRFVRENTLNEGALPVEQIDTSFAWPMGEQWQLVGRLFYDLDEHKGLDTFVGFEYDDCCYRMRLLARRWLDSKLAALVNDENRHYDQALFIEFDLKGLASSGESITQLLRENIPGFGPRP